MCFVQYCTQNKLIIDYAPIYPYKAIIWLRFTVSIQLTAINIMAGKFEVSTVWVFYLHKLYCTVMVCAALVAYLVLLLSGTLNHSYNSSFGLVFVYYKILAKSVRL